MPVFISSTNTTELTSALLSSNSGIAIVPGSVVLNASADAAVSIYDGSIAPLGIGSGLLLTSGWAPGLQNDSTGDGQDNSYASGFDNGDADINAVVNTVFQTQSYDATALSFDFVATDINATSISFDVVFGSEEYPEWVDAFVDCAVVIVNGVNYALFNHDPNAPLSVISQNLAAGYFQDNAGNQLSIQYDGVSQVLKIVAPIDGNSAVNHIKIGISDTGDHVLDSGIFISNLMAGNIPGSGVVSSGGDGTSGDDHMTGSSKSEYFHADAGNDDIYAGGGDDIVIAGTGNDAVYGGSGADEMEGDAGDDYIDGGLDVDTAVYAGNKAAYAVAYDVVTGKTTVVSVDDGKDTLLNVEQVKFKDGLFALNNGELTAVTTGSSITSNTLGTVSISGVVMAGKTLSAMVVDTNGVDPATVQYEWSTSTDGQNWSVVGQQATFDLGTDAAGLEVKVSATYTDKQGYAEAVLSSVVTVAQTSNKISVTPMALLAPVGAGVQNPLTTLVQQATTLGYSPSEASLLIKNALGVDASINLATYDFYARLTEVPTDVQAMVFGKVAGLVAMSASVSDPSGLNLTLAVLAAAAQGHTLDLTNAADLSAAGLDSGAIAFVQGLNQDMADAQTFDKMKKVWDDWAGQKDNLKPLKGHFETISVDLNQAPIGFAVNEFKVLAGDTLTINANDLLAGFTDPDGDALAVLGLQADQGGSFINNGDGSWTFTPAQGFNGPVEMSYTVSDGQIATKATALLVVDAPVNHLPTGDVLITGVAKQGQTLVASNTLSDTDGLGVIAYQWMAGGVAIAGATASTYVLGANEVGKVITVNASYTDGLGTYESVASGATSAVLALTGVTLNGTAKADTLNGTAGKDILNGMGGNDTLNGGGGNDVLIGGAGTDKMNGGAGSDIYLIAASVDHGAAEVADTGLTGVDEIRFAATTASTLTLYAGDTGLERVTVGTGMGASAIKTGTYAHNVNAALVKNGLTIVGNAGANALTGTAFADTLDGGQGADKLVGGAGNDWIFGGAGKDTINGGLGNDVLAYSASTDSDRNSTDVVQNVNFGGSSVGTAVDRFHFDGITIVGTTFLNNVSTNAMGTLAALQNTLNAVVMPVGQAVLMNVTSGVGIGTYLFVDANGMEGYQASGDYAIQLVGVANLTGFDLSDLTA